MSTPPGVLYDEGFTYMEIAIVMVEFIEMSHEQEGYFLADFQTYLKLSEYSMEEIILYRFFMEQIPEFHQLERIAVEFMLEYQETSKKGTGSASKNSMKIADFLQEIFTRFHNTRDQC